MVICAIVGGLGNQLFQYAAGRALATRLNTTLKLDTYYFRNARRRTYELERFCIRANLITPFEEWFAPRCERPRPAKIIRTLHRYGLRVGFTTFHDQERGFDDQFLSVKGNICLRGFWQSERYFVPIADMIRQEFTFRSEPDSANRALIDQIQSTEAVTLHVRRGDYTTKAKDKHGTCSLDYYQEAVDKMVPRVHNPHFFIFSDDPDWTRENIKIGFPSTYVAHNTGRQDFEDLRLMSHCKHFIIANSTFSWWGAWLSRNLTKQIMAPRRWFGDPEKTTTDLIPSNWMLL